MATANSTTCNQTRAGAKKQKAAPAALSLTQKCQFGVTVFEDGSMAELKTGHFTADQAEEIAIHLNILAAKVRNTARRCT